MANDLDLSGIVLTGGSIRVGLECRDCGGRLSWASEQATTLDDAIEAISDHVRVNHPERVRTSTAP